MKFRMLITTLLAVLLLSSLCGCALARVDEQLDAVEDAVEDRIDMAEDALEQAVQTANVTAPIQTAPQAAITREQAEAIALEHAGFTADQVSYLRTEYEIDDGIPQYEVSFHEGRWEYDYEINAETGAILSYDRDD